MAMSPRSPVRYVLRDPSSHRSRMYHGQDPHPADDGSYSDAGRTSESFGEQHLYPGRCQGGKQRRDDGGYGCQCAATGGPPGPGAVAGGRPGHEDGAGHHRGECRERDLGQAFPRQHRYRRSDPSFGRDDRGHDAYLP